LRVGGGAWGADHQQSGMFSYSSAGQRVPKDHRLRAVRVMVERALNQLSHLISPVKNLRTNSAPPSRAFDS
jgi:hypothetical protein